MSILVRQGHQFCSADGNSHGLCSWISSDTVSGAIGAAMSVLWLGSPIRKPEGAMNGTMNSLPFPSAVGEATPGP